jgi:hypothetical protein
MLVHKARLSDPLRPAPLSCPSETKGNEKATPAQQGLTPRHLPAHESRVPVYRAERESRRCLSREAQAAQPRLDLAVSQSPERESHGEQRECEQYKEERRMPVHRR